MTASPRVFTAVQAASALADCCLRLGSGRVRAEAEEKLATLHAAVLRAADR